MSWPLSSEAPRATIRSLAVDGDEARLEGRRGPFRQRVDRLDVVVRVEQDVRIARAAAGHGRRPWDGRRSGGRDASKPRPTSSSASQSAAARHARRIGGVGRDALDPEKPEQAVEARRQALRRSSSEPHQAWRLLSRRAREASATARGAKAGGLYFGRAWRQVRERGHLAETRCDDGRTGGEGSARQPASTPRRRGRR